MRRSTACWTVLFLLLALLAACNLTSAPDATPTPIRITQIVPVTATPFVATTPVPGSIVIGATPIPGSAAAAPAPASTNAIDWLINTVVIPAWNFLYTLFLQSVGSLWSFAGARGGIIAQVFCCIVPGILMIGLLIRRFIWRRFMG